jgi:toxin HigB-1
MIKSFRNKALKDLFMDGKSHKLDQKLVARCLVRLDVLDQAERPEDLNLPGFNFHGLQGNPRLTPYTLMGLGALPLSGVELMLGL